MPTIGHQMQNMLMNKFVSWELPFNHFNPFPAFFSVHYLVLIILVDPRRPETRFAVNIDKRSGYETN